MEPNKILRLDCLRLAVTLHKTDSDGNRIGLSDEEIVGAATKFFNFIATANEKENKNG